MRLIEKIEIKSFRSLKSVTLKNVNHMNIFSGINDSGKSNVLIALDIFFNHDKINFYEEFNKQRLEDVRKSSVKGKQYINIKIHFLNPGGYKSLPEKFFVSKIWGRTGNLINIKDNLYDQYNREKINVSSYNKVKAGLTSFLNKIEFTYIPAVKDDKFFYHLLFLLQQSLFGKTNKDEKNINSITQKFNKELARVTQQLSDDFKADSGILSTLSFPTNISELFERLNIDTQSGEHLIPLRLRGDGLRMRYIPTILNYIAKNSKKYHIWGFDEPENSCEYSLTKQLAEDFSSIYSKNSQIFLATHSFHFISLNREPIERYRVCKDRENINSEIISINKKNIDQLQDELGIIQLNEKLSETYDKLEKERKEINNLKEKYKEANKPFLILEGPSDNILFAIAFKSLYNKDIDNYYNLSNHQTNNYGTTVGANAAKINDFLYNHATKIPDNKIVIGVFDFDKEGFDQFEALKNSFQEYMIDNMNFSNVFKHNNRHNIFAITLYPPDHRQNFVNYSNSKHCFITTEILLKNTEIPFSNRDYPSPNEREVFSFKGKKINFAKKIRDKYEREKNIDFEGFRGTFEVLNKIVGYDI
jgi:hypothetical protein